jgi:hypothetical protein
MTSQPATLTACCKACSVQLSVTIWQGEHVRTAMREALERIEAAGWRRGQAGFRYCPDCAPGVAVVPTAPVQGP